jgi:hypothetical protein
MDSIVVEGYSMFFLTEKDSESVSLLSEVG